MEWKKGDKYFFKLDDGSCITGEITGMKLFGDIDIIIVNDKFNNEVGFRVNQIIKYEKLITNVNKVNNPS